MPFKITETAGFIAFSPVGLEAWTAACCAVAACGRPSAAATASAVVAFLCMLSLQVLAIATRRKALANTAVSHKRSGLPGGRTRREPEVRANRIRSARRAGEEERPTLSPATRSGSGRLRAQGPPVRCRLRDTRCTARRDG